MKLLSIIFILAFGLSAFGQAKKPLPKPKPAVAKPTPAPTPEIPKTSNIEIEAAVIFQNGDVVPVARTNFYLIDTDLNKVLNTPEMKQIAIDDAIKLNKRSNMTDATEYEIRSMNLQIELINIGGLSGLLARMQNSSYENYSKQAIEAVNKTFKFQTVSDFQGKAEFKDVPAGKYFLFAMFKIRGKFIAWQVPVEAGGETVKIILDSNNRLQ